MPMFLRRQAPWKSEGRLWGGLCTGGDLAVYFGASRIAPSSRITSPLSMSFSMMCLASLA